MLEIFAIREVGTGKYLPNRKVDQSKVELEVVKLVLEKRKRKMQVMAKAPLVGAKFHRPAMAILEHLGKGAKLQLSPEPENPYDGDAIRVEVYPKEIGKEEYPALEEKLLGFGFDLEEVLSWGSVFLGYIISSNNKALALCQGCVGNGKVKEIVEGLGGWGWEEAQLAFDGNGRPLVEIGAKITEKEEGNE